MKPADWVKPVAEIVTLDNEEHVDRLLATSIKDLSPWLAEKRGRFAMTRVQRRFALPPPVCLPR